MMIETLRYTPIWVWGLLLMLTVIGASMMKTRTVSVTRLTVLPVLMTVYSFSSALLSFGARPAYSLAWLAGMAGAFLLIRTFSKPSNARYLAERHAFEVPGSVTPLLLMLAIFSLKYTIGVLSVRAPMVVAEPQFAVLASAMLGMLSASFLARSVAIQATRQRGTVSQLLPASN
jgi:hypothetical protein